jgi:hypothetical protein
MWPTCDKDVKLVRGKPLIRIRIACGQEKGKAYVLKIAANSRVILEEGGPFTQEMWPTSAETTRPQSRRGG